LKILYTKLTSAVRSHAGLNIYLRLILCIYELTNKIIQFSIEGNNIYYNIIKLYVPTIGINEKIVWLQWWLKKKDVEKCICYLLNIYIINNSIKV